MHLHFDFNWITEISINLDLEGKEIYARETYSLNCRGCQGRVGGNCKEFCFVHLSSVVSSMSNTHWVYAATLWFIELPGFQEIFPVEGEAVSLWWKKLILAAGDVEKGSSNFVSFLYSVVRSMSNTHRVFAAAFWCNRITEISRNLD